jgi:hypothetical protein
MALAFVELIKAEAQGVKEQIARVAVAIGILIGAAVFLLTGLGLLLAAFYMYLERIQDIQPTYAVLYTAGVSLLLGILLAWWGSRKASK